MIGALNSASGSPAGSPEPTSQTPATNGTRDNGPEATSTALDPAFLKSALMHPEGRYGRVEVVGSAGSTNTDLADAAADPQQFWPDLSVLIADAQPAGKGRLGRSWEVPAGAAMISSILVFPTSQVTSHARSHAAPHAATHDATAHSSVDAAGFDPLGYGWLSILAGMALCETLRTVAGVPAELKWPNDVVIGGRKVAGLLAQVVPASNAQPTNAQPANAQPSNAQPTNAQTASAAAPTTPTPSASSATNSTRASAGQRAQAGIGVVIGAGLNVSLQREQLPTERATSLLLESATTLDRNELLAAYLNTFAARYEEFVAAGGRAQTPLAGGPSLWEITRDYMGTLGQEVRAELPGGTMLHGTAVGLGADGGLELRDDAGTVHHVSAGDVIHLRRTAADGTVNYA